MENKRITMSRNSSVTTWYPSYWIIPTIAVLYTASSPLNAQLSQLDLCSLYIVSFCVLAWGQSYVFFWNKGLEEISTASSKCFNLVSTASFTEVEGFPEGLSDLPLFGDRVLHGVESVYQRGDCPNETLCSINISMCTCLLNPYYIHVRSLGYLILLVDVQTRYSSNDLQEE